MSDLRLCTRCRWHRAGVSDMGVPPRCGAAVPVVSPVDGSAHWPPCHQMREPGAECGPRGDLWERGGIVGWAER